MVVDALNNMTWSYNIGDGEEHGGPLLNAGIVADWLRAGSIGEVKQADIDSQATVIVGVIRLTANVDLSHRPHWIQFQNERRPSVCRLDLAVDSQMGMLNSNDPLPFRAWNAAENMKSEPKVPILYVAIPVTVAIWLGGLWVMLRRGRRATLNVRHNVAPINAEAHRPQDPVRP
jgi:hypothetical protein